MSKLSHWVAGAVAGCPGVIDSAPPDEPPAAMPAPPDEPASRVPGSATPSRQRGPWVTAAGVILVGLGCLGIVYAPFLAGVVVWRFLGFGISAYTVVGVLEIATGIGLLRLHRWARIAAGLLAACGLLFIQAPALLAAAASGSWFAIDWLGFAGSLVILFAVVRRWPAPSPRAA